MGSRPRQHAVAAQADARENGEPDDAALLGAKIRALRVQQDKTLKAVATAASVSESLVSQVERGRASPSITTLRQIADALGVPIATFFVEASPATSDDFDRHGRQLVVRHDERKVMHLPRSHVGYELLTPDLNRKVEFLWIEYEPGAISPRFPMGHVGEENAICLKGSVVVSIDGEHFTLEEGDSISFDASNPHQAENRTSELAILVSAITPPRF